MSSSSVIQGRQSRFEPGKLIETRFSSPKAVQKETGVPKPEPSGWSFIECLSDNTDFTQNRAGTERRHRVSSQPDFHSPSPKLSEKSLEMCTESLGSETGNGLGDEISLLSLQKVITCGARNQTQNAEEDDLVKTKRLRHTTSFPPPIKSIAGSSEGVKVKSYREDGRLVLRAVAVSPARACFQAERSGGRLRLCITKDSANNNVRNEEENSGTSKGNDEFGREEIGFEEEGEEEEMDGNNEDVGGKMGSEKLQGLSRRCKEGGESGQRSLLNWETCWVAI